MKRSRIESLTKDDYKRAFLAVHPLADHHFRILKAHFNTPDQVATATQLADAVGYAKQTRTQSKRNLELRSGVVVECSGNVRARWGTGEEHWKLIMRPAAVEALQELNWF